MRHSVQAAEQGGSPRPVQAGKKQESAELASIKQPLDLDYWVHVIAEETKKTTGRMPPVAEVRARVVARVEDALMSGETPDVSACERLGVPTFAELVRANADAFPRHLVRRIG